MEELLGDLAQQSDPGFFLLVVSDGKVEGLSEKAKRLARGLGAKFVVYDDVVGVTDPSLSWSRAVSHVSQGWVWLLGDDDRVGPGCVEAFNRLETSIPEEINICRFPVQVLGTEVGSSAPVREGPRIVETNKFLASRLLGRELSFASEYLFRKSRYDEVGGFVHFPFAWCSDDATWVELSHPHGILQLAGVDAKVFWRNGSENTSSKIRLFPHEFSNAERGFIRWLQNESSAREPFHRLRWRLMFAWWFVEKSQKKNLERAVMWKQVFSLGDDVRMARITLILIFALRKSFDSAKAGRRVFLRLIK